MHKDTIQRIENLIQNGKVTGENKQKLLTLLEKLKAEINALSETNCEKALAIARYAETSSSIAVCPKPDSKELDSSLDTLKESVEEFNVTHPRLVSIINEISIMLSSIGI